jgi:beta-lysine 5,6-aminomutase alpha subunit
MSGLLGSGVFFKGHIQDAMFNTISIMTNQGIQLLGMPTEAIHTPLLQDRALSIDNAKYIFNNMRNISEEIEFKKDGIIQKRAQEVLKESRDMLKEIKERGLMETIEAGKFAEVKRAKTGGKGLKGVFLKSEKYMNPFIELMLGVSK